MSALMGGRGGATRRSFAAVLLVMLAVGACGGDGDGDGLECEDGCNFLEAADAARVVSSGRDSTALVEHGWVEPIAAELGDVSSLLGCEFEVASVTVLTWVFDTNGTHIDVGVAGWADDRMACFRRQQVRVSHVPDEAFVVPMAEALDAGDESVRWYFPENGDTFLVPGDSE